MAKYISNELARLIRERSYSSGAIAMLDKEAADIAVTFVQLRQRLRKIRPKRRKELARLAKIDAEITRQLSVDGQCRYFDKAKYDPARAIGLRRCANGYFIDAIQASTS